LTFFRNGAVSGDFVQKLKNLNSDNSKGDLCIEKYLEKAEKAHFVLLKKEKIESSKASGYGGSSIYTKDEDDDDNLMPEIPLTSTFQSYSIFQLLSSLRRRPISFADFSASSSQECKSSWVDRSESGLFTPS